MGKRENNKILLIDDHELIVMGIKHIIQKEIPEITEIDSAPSLKGTLQCIQSTNYDLYIVDLELIDSDGFNIIDNIRNVYPDARIIVNTMHDELWYYRKLEQYEVDSIVYKSLDSTELVKAIRTVLSGGTFYCKIAQELAKKKKKSLLGQPLSEREKKVLKCIAEGKNTNEIAEELFISVNTVETHRRHLNEKLDAKNVASLIMKAVSKGLLSCEDL